MNEHPPEDKEWIILKSALENTHEGFVTIDENHRVVFFNKAAEKIFGYRREEVIGNDLDVIMTPRCSRDHHQAVDHYIVTQIPRSIGHHTDITATRKNGDPFPASISFSLSEVEGHRYFTGVVRDLTETKALQDQIIKAERLAALGQVVAEITHEIKNPLMTIGGFARRLRLESGDPQTLEKLGIIVAEVSRLEDLLQELRDYYLPRALTEERVEINRLLQEVMEMVQEDCKNRNIQATLMSGKDNVALKGDRDKLKQVLLNVSKNAIEAIEEGGNLSFESKTFGDLIEITIRDDGCGLSEEEQKKIFSPFYTTKPQGTGLGLNVSKRIINDHVGSSFALKSKKGKGSEVIIRMPLFKEDF